jgi:hypothetical protein
MLLSCPEEHLQWLALPDNHIHRFRILKDLEVVCLCSEICVQVTLCKRQVLL